MEDELAGLDAMAQAALVRDGKVTPTELVDAAIARAERIEPALDSIVTRQFDRARAEAASSKLPDGPFRGVPYLLKDLGAYLDGDPVYAGMGALARADFREQGDAVFAARLRAAGMISLGRTNSPELGILPATEPDAFPPTRNPWNTEHSAGGSSGGAGAAVAARIVPVAHASDGGGSIRIPAAHNGLVGLKPSRARNSFAPDLGERWGGCSCEGFVTHSVRDTAALLDVTAGPALGDPYTAPPPARPFVEEVGVPAGALRIGVLSDGPRGIEVSPDCAEGARTTGALLETLGHAVEAAHPAALDDPSAPGAYVTLVAVSTARSIEKASAKIGRELGQEDVEPLTWALTEIARKRSALDYQSGGRRRCTATGAICGAWWAEGFDLLVSPTCGAPPPPLGHLAQTPEAPLEVYGRAAAFGMYTLHFNMSGQPAISLPLHETPDGLPVGVQLVAAPHREDLLIRVAAQLEQASPWTGSAPTAARLKRAVQRVRERPLPPRRIFFRRDWYCVSETSPFWRASSRSASARSCAGGEVRGDLRGLRARATRPRSSPSAPGVVRPCRWT